MKYNWLEADRLGSCPDALALYYNKRPLRRSVSQRDTRKGKDTNREERYEIIVIEQQLCENAYPGRGIVIGKSEDGKYAVTAYFIMEGAPTAAIVFLWKKAGDSNRGV